MAGRCAQTLADTAADLITAYTLTYASCGTDHRHVAAIAAALTN